MSVKVKYKIISGMDVVLTTGDSEYRGKKFKVLSVKDGYVTLDGFKKLKKFVKPNPEAGNENFKLIDKKVHISNVAAFDPSSKKQSKITFKIEGGKKIKIYKKSGNEVKNN